MSNLSSADGAMIETTLPTMLRQALSTVRQQMDVMKRRRQLRDELEQCSDRELADMGLCRSDIDAVADGIRLS